MIKALLLKSWIFDVVFWKDPERVTDWRYTFLVIQVDGATDTSVFFEVCFRWECEFKKGAWGRGPNMWYTVRCEHDSTLFHLLGKLSEIVFDSTILKMAEHLRGSASVMWGICLLFPRAWWIHKIYHSCSTYSGAFGTVRHFVTWLLWCFWPNTRRFMQ